MLFVSRCNKAAPGHGFTAEVDVMLQKTGSGELRENYLEIFIVVCV